MLSRVTQCTECMSFDVTGSSGHAVFSSLIPGVYTLRVVATNRHPDKEFIKRRFEVTTDAERCTLHLINDGVTVTGDSATVEFTGRGPVKDYHCQLDMMEFYECKFFLQSFHEDASDISMQALVLRYWMD